MTQSRADDTPHDRADGESPTRELQIALVASGHRPLDAETRRELIAATRHADAEVRALALSGLARQHELTAGRLQAAFVDPSPLVRRRAAELAVDIDIDEVSPAELLNDTDPSVVEAAAFACGERQWAPGTAPVHELSLVAQHHDDPLNREAAAAALGAIGDPAGLAAVLQACDDRVTVRRRATLALAAFDDPAAEARLRLALDDRDWQVRQAAEDLLEVGRVLEGDLDPDAFADGADPAGDR